MHSVGRTEIIPFICSKIYFLANSLLFPINDKWDYVQYLLFFNIKFRKPFESYQIAVGIGGKRPIPFLID